MKYISKEDFLDWAKRKGFKAYIEPNNYFLTLENDTSLKKFWIIPKSLPGAAISHFLSAFLENVDKWEKCYIFKTDGKWGTFGPSGNVWGNLINKLGVQENFEGAIEYERSELVDLLSLLYVQTFFMWCGADQFFLVFDHAEQLIFVDEDRKLHVEFCDRKKMDHFVSNLGNLGYSAQDKSTK